MRAFGIYSVLVVVVAYKKKCRLNTILRKGKERTISPRILPMLPNFRSVFLTLDSIGPRDTLMHILGWQLEFYKRYSLSLLFVSKGRSSSVSIERFILSIFNSDSQSHPEKNRKKVHARRVIRTKR